MIIVRSPLRISLGGGGTDLASYYSKRGGFLIAAAINKYVYINIMKPFKKGIFLKYSSNENVLDVKDIKHSIFREALSLQSCQFDQIEITALADIPSGTGLGSSGSFTTALLQGLYAFNDEAIHPSELAELACHVEIDKLKQPIGKQDQYIASYGGLSKFEFSPNGSVVSSTVKVAANTLERLEENLLLFFTGFQRSASAILKDQNTKSLENDMKILTNLDRVKAMGIESERLLLDGDLNGFAQLMDEHWQNKKKRSSQMSNSKINEWYDIGIKNGAIGGKLVGAGGGGFLLFYTENPTKLRKAMAQISLEEIDFKFDFEGTKVLSV